MAKKKEKNGEHPSSHYLVVEKADEPSTWHLRVKDADGNVDRRLMGAAWAALHGGYRGNKYSGPGKGEAISKLTRMYKSQKIDLPSEHAEVLIDAFKAGEYPQGSITEANLDEVVATYDPVSVHEAPIYVGHASDYPDSRAPAFGWIGKVFRVGDHLKVVASEFADELKEMVQKGLYKKVSAAFYKPDTPGNPTPGKWHLHHLAFLGATPPAVKGLEAVQLSEFDESKGALLEFASYQLKDAAELCAQDTYEEIQEAFARTLTLIEGILTSDDIEEDDAAMAASNALCAAYCDAMEAVRDHFTFTEKAESILEGLKSKTAEMAEKGKEILKGMLLHLKSKPIHESNPHKEEIPVMGATTQEQEAKVLELSERIKTLETEKKTLADKAIADAAKAADERIRGEVTAFMESLKTKGFPVKKLEELHVSDMLFQLAKANATVEYGEKKEQKPIAELFKQLLGDLPKPPEGTVPELDKDLVEYAASRNLTGKMKQRDVQILQFAEKYVSDHKDEFKGLDERQATAQAISRVMLGTIKMTE